MHVVPRLGYYLLIFFAVLSLLYLSQLHTVLEPDSYFHFAISKLTLDQGLVQSIPQADDIGWASYFPEKEFLFHQLTALAFNLRGESGVQIACLIISSLIFVLIVLNCEQFCSKPLALALSFITLVNFPFLGRMLMIRPHLVGILFFLMILLGLIKADKKILLTGSFLFPLFYHAFFLPLMFLGIFGVVERGRNYRLLLLYGFLPMVAGILVNPYFPGNIFMTWEAIKIAFSMNHSLNVGVEAQRLPVLTSLVRSGPFLVISLGLLTQVKYLYSESKRTTALLIGVLVLHLLYFISQRTVEYLVPTFAILLSAAVPFMSKKNPQFGFIAVVTILAINIQFVANFTIKDNFWTPRGMEMQELLAKIPASSGKVFNCEWESGSYILYFQPTLKFVDILDPNFIFLQNPELGKLREKMVFAPTPRIYETLVNIFKADYIMCFNPHFLKVVEQDPRFVKIGESKRLPITKIFKITK